MKQKIVVEVSGQNFEAELSDEKAPATFKKVLQALPIESEAQTWGEEIYFTVPFKQGAENATREMEVGDLAFWPEGPAIAVFFGRTPMSTGEKPVPYSECSWIGRLLNVSADKERLLKVRAGEKIAVRKV